MSRRPRLGRVFSAVRRRRVGAALALAATIGVVVAIVLITQSSTSPGSANASSRSSGATAVQRRDLVASDTESGTLSYANPQTVYNRLSGTITWLPPVGQLIRQGEALFKVNGMPVTLLNGSTPAYRDLDASDTAGPDILQLNRDLVALGYTSEGIVADDVWQPATTAAVDLFQEALGETATGTLSLGQIVFLPGSQIVSTVEGTVGSAASDSNPTPATEFVSLNTTTTTTPGTTPTQNPTKHHHHRHPAHATPGGASATSLEALIALLRAEIAELRAASHSGSPSSHGGSPSSHGGSPSSHGGSGNGGSGNGGSGNGGSGNGGSGNGGSGNGGGGAATAVLQTTSTQLVATVDLDASKQSEAKVGEKVTVQMPAGNTVEGTITAVSPVAQSSSNNGNNGNGNGNGGNGNGNGSSGATVPVTITLKGHQSGAGLDQAAVSVNFVQSEANNVLSVPVTALLATAGGGYAVQSAAPPHTLIPVTTGLFAAGYVQISGAGIYPGLEVTDSQG